MPAANYHETRALESVDGFGDNTALVHAAVAISQGIAGLTRELRINNLIVLRELGRGSAAADQEIAQYLTATTTPEGNQH